MIGAHLRFGLDIARQQTLTARIARGQSDVATGARLQVASDDPAAAARIAQIDARRIDNSAWATVAARGAALAAAADTTLASVQDGLDRARELVTNAVSATASIADRATYAAELRAIADDVDALSRTTDPGGTRLFSDGAPLGLPVDGTRRIAATLSIDDAFGSGRGQVATVLRAAADALVDPDPTLLANTLDAVVGAADALADARGRIGIAAARFDAVRVRLGDGESALAEERGTLADTDVAATIARIQADQLTLDAARGLFARVNRQTLFDLLA